MNKEAEKKEGENPAPNPAETAPATPEPAFVTVSNEAYKAVLAQAAQATELKDRLLRAQAEWDNSRKRIMREKEDAIRYAGEAFLEKLLPVLDNFEMGMQAAKTATDPKSIAQGLEMVLAQFHQVLRDAGVEPIAQGSPAARLLGFCGQADRREAF
jgi:molecular chaperone GrpE